MLCLVMFITAVCLIFLLKLKWPKNKSVYECSHLLLKHQESDVRKRNELQNEAVGEWDEARFQNGGRRNSPAAFKGVTILTNAVSGQSQNCSGNLEISPGIGTLGKFSGKQAIIPGHCRKKSRHRRKFYFMYPKNSGR